MKSSNEKVNEFLHDIKTTSSEKWATVEEIRNTFLGENLMLEEDIKYGRIIYGLSGDLIGGVFTSILGKHSTRKHTSQTTNH